MSIAALDDAWQHSPYSGAGLLVHLAIADGVGWERFVRFDANRIAARARCKPEYVVRQVRRMVRDGWLHPVDYDDVRAVFGNVLPEPDLQDPWFRMEELAS